MRLIQVHLSKLGHRVFRNNTGKIRSQDGRWIAFGLCVGSSDLIGWTKDGFFLAIEVKTESGKISFEQEHFINIAKSFGCRAGIARSEIDAEDIASGKK